VGLVKRGGVVLLRWLRMRELERLMREVCYMLPIEEKFEYIRTNRNSPGYFRILPSIYLRIAPAPCMTIAIGKWGSGINADQLMLLSRPR